MPDDPTEVVDPEDPVPVATGRTPTPTAKTHALTRPEVIELELGDPDQVIGFVESLLRKLHVKRVRNDPIRVRVRVEID